MYLWLRGQYSSNNKNVWAWEGPLSDPGLSLWCGMLLSKHLLWSVWGHLVNSIQEDNDQAITVVNTRHHHVRSHSHWLAAHWDIQTDWRNQFKINVLFSSFRHIFEKYQIKWELQILTIRSQKQTNHHDISSNLRGYPSQLSDSIYPDITDTHYRG